LIAEILRPRAYRLQEIDGEAFPNAWYIELLRKFYPKFSLSFTSSPFCFSPLLQASG
jgi:hypothetical protein